MRGRPAGRPLLLQTWETLLFLHWRLPAGELAPHLPAGLTVDTFDGSAWLGVVPFTMKRSRPPFGPPLPYLSDFHEINVRTYVHRQGVPGVFFFSLDATSAPAVYGARALYRLPYHLARISLEERDGAVHYRSERRRGEARFRAVWRVEAPLPEAQVGSLEFFLVERYALFTRRGTTLLEARVHHEPWPLRRGTLLELESSMLSGNGLAEPGREPHVLATGPVDVEIFAPRPTVRP